MLHKKHLLVIALVTSRWQKWNILYFCKTETENVKVWVNVLSYCFSQNVWKSATFSFKPNGLLFWFMLQFSQLHNNSESRCQLFADNLATSMQTMGNCCNPQVIKCKKVLGAAAYIFCKYFLSSTYQLLPWKFAVFSCSGDINIWI